MEYLFLMIMKLFLWNWKRYNKRIKNSFENNLNDNKKGKILEIKRLNLQNINNIIIPLHSKNIIEKK